MALRREVDGDSCDGTEAGQPAAVTAKISVTSARVHGAHRPARINELDQQQVGYVSAVRRLHLWSGQDVIALGDLYVRPEARNLGVGKILMSELARRFQNRHTIAWGMQPDNHAAMRFYERLGANLYPKVLASWPPDRQPS
jgi:ribosomal protein S18 acetylase RimI-like enzyme